MSRFQKPNYIKILAKKWHKSPNNCRNGYVKKKNLRINVKLVDDDEYDFRFDILNLKKRLTTRVLQVIVDHR